MKGAVRLAALAVIVALAGCNSLSTRNTGSTALRVSSGDLQTAQTLVYLVPGVLTSTTVFGPALKWGRRDVAVIEYRFPGLDQRALEGRVNIVEAGREIAAHAARAGAEKVVLIGFSTGAAIAVEAGARLPGKDVGVAGVSSAVPFPGMLMAGAGSSLDFVTSVGRADALEYDPIWKDYYRTLLLGRNWPFDAGKRAQADALMKAYADVQAEPPSGGIGRSHANNLLVWQLTPEAETSGARMVFWHGSDDTIAPLPKARRFADRIGAEMRILPRTGHMALEVHAGLIKVIGTEFGVLR